MAPISSHSPNGIPSSDSELFALVRYFANGFGFTCYHVPTSRIPGHWSSDPGKMPSSVERIIQDCKGQLVAKFGITHFTPIIWERERTSPFPALIFEDAPGAYFLTELVTLALFRINRPTNLKALLDGRRRLRHAEMDLTPVDKRSRRQMYAGLDFGTLMEGI